MPSLTQRLLTAPPAAQRRVAEASALKALQAAAVNDDPRAAAVTAGFGQETPADLNPAAELLVEVSPRADVLNRTDPHGTEAFRANHAYAWLAASGVKVLRYAAAADPVPAAIGVAEALRPFVGHDN